MIHYGLWYMWNGAWWMIHVRWNMMYDTWGMIHGRWYIMGNGICEMKHVKWNMVVATLWWSWSVHKRWYVEVVHGGRLIGYRLWEIIHGRWLRDDTWVDSVRRVVQVWWCDKFILLHDRYHNNLYNVHALYTYDIYLKELFIQSMKCLSFSSLLQRSL